MILIKTIDAVEHLLALKADNEPDFEQYAPNSLATRDALATAYNRGDWKPYTPPVIESAPPLPLPPDWKTFRLALLKSKSFRLWSELLPNSWREDLKMAAMVGNAEALQDIYNYCKSISLPIPASTSEWQQLADKSNIPVKF